jgi:hypothetical protein
MKEIYKDHPIVDAPYRYKVVDFHYHGSLEDPDEKWIDMVLQKGDEKRRLRFMRPVTITMEEAFPECPGFYIADLSKDGLEDLKVRVGDFEAGGGGISFWAAGVIDLDKE